MTEILATQLRLSNEIAKLDVVSKTNDELVQQVADVRKENDLLVTQVASLMKPALRQIAPRQLQDDLVFLKYITDTDEKRKELLPRGGVSIALYFTPEAYDAEALANQLWHALIPAHFSPEKPQPFLAGSFNYFALMRPLYKERANNRALAIRRANITICVSEKAEPAVIELQQLLREALNSADVTAEAVPFSFAADDISIVVGNGSSSMAAYVAYEADYFRNLRHGIS